MSDYKTVGINWKGGAFRLWIIASVLWCMVVAGLWVILAGEQRAPIIYVKVSETESWPYSAEWSVQQIRDDIQNRKFQKCRGDAEKGSNKAVSADEFFCGLNSSLPSNEWESKVARAPVSWTKFAAPLIPLATIPPLVLLALGAALFWAFDGFSRNRS